MNISLKIKKVLFTLGLVLLSITLLAGPNRKTFKSPNLTAYDTIGVGGDNKYIVDAISSISFNIGLDSIFKIHPDSASFRKNIRFNEGIYWTLADTATDDTLSIWFKNGTAYSINLSKSAGWAFNYPLQPLFIRMLEAKIKGEYKLPFMNENDSIVKKRSIDKLWGIQQLRVQSEFSNRHLFRTQVFFLTLILLIVIYFKTYK